jgi:hypothetical protein
MKSQENHYSQGDEILLGGFIPSDKAKSILGCSESTLYFLRKNGYLSYSKIGRKLFFEIESIQNLLKKNLKKAVK